MTRILVITNMYPPHHLGGYELVCRDVVERWRDNGHDVVVLTTTMSVPSAVSDAAQETSVRRELDFYYRDHLIYRPGPWRALKIERQNHVALDRTMNELDPEVVSFWHMGAMSMSMISKVASLGLPSIFVLGDAWFAYGPEVDAWTNFFTRRPWLSTFAARMTGIPTSIPEAIDGASLFVSEWLREQIAPRSAIRSRYTAVVPHGVSHRDFPLSPRTRRPWSWRLIYAGRMDERKGVHVAIRALSHLPAESTLHIWGRGDEKYLAQLQELAADLGIADRVHFGALPRHALRDEYVGSDVFVFPNLWDEPFGLVPLEAMACGTPVVTTATGGSAEFCVHGSNCLVFQRDDDRGLADAVRRLADDGELRDRIVASGLRTAEIFSVDRMAEALERWHVAAADRFRHGAPDTR